MNEDLILKCLISFILGWLISKQMGNGFSIHGGKGIFCNPYVTQPERQLCPGGYDCPDCGSDRCECPDPDSAPSSSPPSPPPPPPSPPSPPPSPPPPPPPSPSPPPPSPSPPPPSPSPQPPKKTSNKKCLCENGTPVTGPECKAKNQPLCDKCDKDYTKTNFERGYTPSRYKTNFCKKNDDLVRGDPDIIHPPINWIPTVEATSGRQFEFDKKKCQKPVFEESRELLRYLTYSHQAFNGCCNPMYNTPSFGSSTTCKLMNDRIRYPNGWITENIREKAARVKAARKKAARVKAARVKAAEAAAAALANWSDPKIEPIRNSWCRDRGSSMSNRTEVPVGNCKDIKIYPDYVDLEGAHSQCIKDGKPCTCDNFYETSGFHNLFGGGRENHGNICIGSGGAGHSCKADDSTCAYIVQK